MTRLSRQLIDITLPLSSGTLVYPGDSPPDIQRVSDLNAGDVLTASRFTLGCHVGTHVDAPAHFLAQGKMLDELPLESFYGPAVVIGIQGKPSIEKADLEGFSLPRQYHILIKTENGVLLNAKTFSEKFCTLTTEAAKYLCQLNPLSIGWDYYSLDPVTSSETFPAHRVLAQADIPVFVCLNFRGVAEGSYGFSGFPLRLEGVEGSPVRAILITEESETIKEMSG